MEPFSDLFLFIVYIAAWLLLLPAAIFVIYGIRSQAKITFRIGVICAVLSGIAFIWADYTLKERPKINRNSYPEEDDKAMEEVFARFDDENPGGFADNPDSVFTRGAETIIQFNECMVAVDSFETDEHQVNAEDDTAFVNAAWGGSIEGQTIVITSRDYHHFVLEQCCETSVTIAGEGPHCDLYEWEHYLSPWQKLDEDGKGNFKGEHYIDQDWNRFMKSSATELKTYVKKQCGTEWYNRIKNITVIGQYPSIVTIGRIYLRITGKHKITGTKTVKLISIKIPMGC